MNNKQPNPSFNETEVTLRFLANSVYQEVMEKKTAVKEPTKDDYKFYKKRAFAMVKDMMRGKFPSKHLKDVHMKYVNELINYMKVQDTADILQSDYPTDELVADEVIDDNVFTCPELMEEANKLMMKDLDTGEPTLDDFVTKKVIRIKEPLPPPKIRVADISTDEHKTKGLKSKKKKKNDDGTNKQTKQALTHSD